MRYEAIYARQSVDRADSISIESQIEKCEREVGKDYKIYSDKGFSGKNTDRPELGHLLRNIGENRVSRVIVYRLDRISRSVLDFSSMIRFFQQHEVEFVSTMEKFDTSSPIGNAMLMIIMVFAQLERETIQRRVIDAYKSRSEKGFYMGGRVPYGFTLDEVDMDGVRTKMFVPVKEEINVIRKMYEIYGHPRASFGDVVRAVADLGAKTREGNDFSRVAVRDIIISPIYARFDLTLYHFFLENKVRIVNPQSDFVGIYGGYLYSDVKKRKGKSTNLEGLMLVLAPHEGVIDSRTWMKCRKKCLDHVAVAKPRKAKATWLAGKIKCAECGYALTTGYSGPNGTKYRRRYYLCSHKYQTRTCSFRSIRADDLDAIVLAEMKKKAGIFRDFKVKLHAEKKTGLERLRSRAAELDSEIAKLLEKIPAASMTVMEYINKKVASLDAEKAETELKILNWLNAEDNIAVVNLEEGMERWDAFSFEDKMAVVDCLIESIHAKPGEITIRWRL